MRGKSYGDYFGYTDEELVSLSRDGDDVAFDTLASRYLNTRYAESDASYLDRDDFVQEGMFGFLNAVRTFQSDKNVSFKAYANICMKNSINSAAVSASPKLPVEAGEEAFEKIEGDKDPLGYIISSERLSEVLSACEISLSRLEKTVLYMKAVGMSYKEIGEKLSMEAKAVDNAVQRARTKLKKAIE